MTLFLGFKSSQHNAGLKFSCDLHIEYFCNLLTKSWT